MALEKGLIRHRLDVPNFQIIFVYYRSDSLTLIRETYGTTFLRQLKHNASKWLSIPAS